MADINTGAFSEALNLKADIDLRNIDTNKCDIVIEYQEPDASNNYIWYRLYASGWVEQGQNTFNWSSVSETQSTVYLPIKMETNEYTINLSSTTNVYYADFTKTSFLLKHNNSWTNWTVCGIADMTTHHEILPNPTQNLILQMIESIYPVGSLYMGTQTTCPMAVIIPDSTWELVSDGKALWTGDGSNANTTINAGLPDITGSFTPWGYKNQLDPSGAFTQSETTVHAYASTDASAGSKISFKASNSNTIYGKSTTVQPPAYVVNVWRRTA